MSSVRLDDWQKRLIVDALRKTAPGNWSFKFEETIELIENADTITVSTKKET